MADTRKPWEIPITYTDDRWTPMTPKQQRQADIVAREERRHIDDVEEMLSRPDRGVEERHYECNDTTPVNYGKGPHTEAFGVDEDEVESTGHEPVNYDCGPHESAFLPGIYPRRTDYEVKALSYFCES
jgi:hypothetical protein